MANKKIINNILFEVGTEPLPASFIYSAMKQLKKNAQELLKAHNITYGEIETFDTYRRLVVYIKNVDELQKAKEIELRGPSKEIAYDDNNKPTKALLGFLNKTGIKQIDIQIKKTPQEIMFLVTKKKEANKVSNIGTPKISTGITSATTKVVFNTPIIEELAKTKPNSIEPESPKNIEAGKKLNLKKPSRPSQS